VKSPPRPTSAKKVLGLSLLLLALTLVAYLPALRGGFIWDDDDYVTNNPNLTSISGLWDIWAHPTASPQYYPMVFTTFWAEYQLWGARPFGYHLDNVLLHAISSILLWRILALLRIRGCFLAACLFAVHPLMVESVAWVTERKNVLSGVFYLLAGLVYLNRSMGVPPMSDTGRLNMDGGHLFPASWFFAMGLFVLALLSKTVTCSLPAALLLIMWWKRGRITRRDILPLIPMFILGLALAMYTAYLERTHVQASGTEWSYGPIDPILIAGRAIWFYATKVVLPFNLSFVYPKWTIDPHAAWQWGFPVGVLIVLIVLWLQRRRWGRSPLVVALFFMGTLIPALGFFNIYPMRYTLVADHYAYLATIGLLVPISFGILALWDRIFDLSGVARELARGFQPLCILISILPLLALTMFRANVYRDSESLWRDTLLKNPHSWMVHLNLAKVLASQGREAEAQHQFQQQLKLAPELPETHWNYGINLARRGLLDQALDEYALAIKLGGAHPLPQAFFGKGNVYLEQGKLAQSAEAFEQATRLKPDYAQAWFNLALVREKLSDLAGAENALHRAIAAAPNYAAAHNELGELLARRGKIEPAMEQYRQAIASDPNLAQAHLNLAALLAAQGQTSAAREEFNRAVNLDPTLARFRTQVLRPGMP
jgi:Tfp pilus assembly protein PilF